MALWGLGTCRTRMSALLRSWKKPRFLPAETKLMSDKRAGARLVDRRSTRRVPSREGQAQKAPQATFSNELVLVQRLRIDGHLGIRASGRGIALRLAGGPLLRGLKLELP